MRSGGSREFHAGFHGTAVGVAEDEHELGAQVLGGVEDARKLHVPHHIAGNADGEELAEAGHEDMLGHHARIGAGDDAGKRSLTFRKQALHRVE